MREKESNKAEISFKK